MGTAASLLSNAAIQLDRASGQLEQLNEALTRGETVSAREFVRQYVCTLTSLKTELRSLSIDLQDLNLVGAVLDRLDSHLDRLERMKRFVSAGHADSVEEPLKHLKAIFQLIRNKAGDSLR